MADSSIPPVVASRRGFLKASAATAATAGWWSTTSRSWAAGFRSANERPVCGFIGTGIRYGSLVTEAVKYGPCAALCDVDGAQLNHAVRTAQSVYNRHGVAAPVADLYEDYRRVLDRPDIDIVVIATPDHWHSKIVIEALLAGKDVYCEKPLTHHVAEGQQILSALDRTKRVMQVGSQQRSGLQFQTAVALARSGRAGKINRVTCSIGGCPTSDSLPLCAPPSEMNWNRWLGPAPWAAYRAADSLPDGGYGGEHPYGRGHAHFRWWYEYAGGKLTDWGAHHVDIAMWGLNKSDASIGRFTIDPIKVNHPVEFKDGYPVDDTRFNTATTFEIRVTFEDGAEIDIVDNSERLGFGNGIMFECEDGRFFVNRGKLTGKPVEELKTNPLPESAFTDLYQGPSQAAADETDGDGHEARGSSHMKNFMECVKSRQTPISDVASHHRNLTVCHVSNIAMRLGRKLTYDPLSERFVDDTQADGLLSREPRKGYEYAV
ncbi:Glucose--fructose oxidoreductase precursor [Botrimarina colliarenosi]|uniref:Glucose--fructose oxidoreductase n=1 Tax=Botrimarina colliarenosi TaxID=2528001 RepID=A0A5C6AIT3_9BACT|nr:Gfo/Idh/MocA family oxidoreductase [Botrimarina colliarenosi]TWT99529.1 Glucose--fructose oxidoreductase precursor [Botrimarina colliarenosi]